MDGEQRESAHHRLVSESPKLPTLTSIPCTSAAFAELSAELLRAGKAIRFQARGASMSPLVRDGDVLLVQPVDARAIRVGDVVLCVSEPGRVVVHRVVRRVSGADGDQFTVQGDAVSGPDGLIRQTQVYGRVATIERDGRCILMDRPEVKILSGLAALRSRWNLGRSRLGRGLARLVKKLPFLSKYLS